MNSQEALALAIEQVNKMSTNARGYADGVTLTMKVDAVERLAALLMAEDVDDSAGDPELLVDFGEFWADGIEEGRLNRCNLCGAVVEGYEPHGEWHRGLGR